MPHAFEHHSRRGISQLWRYPVKSMAGERLDAARLTPDGIPGDRVVYAVDGRGQILSARTSTPSATTRGGPPWWTSEKARLMGGRVMRGPPRVIRDVRGEPLEQDDVEGSNPWASMPSDHFGSAAMTAMLLWEIDRRVGAAAWAYALLLGFALVYHGEHYVVDLLAGLALAAAIHRAYPPPSRSRRYASISRAASATLRHVNLSGRSLGQW